MLIIIIIASIFSYLIVATWTFGYICGTLSEEQEKYKPSYYYDEPEPWFGSMFWPIYFLFSLFLLRIMHMAESLGQNNYQVRKVRVELEKKIRVEQEKLQQEAEIEKELRKSSI
jgi:hypothetical protein